MNARMMTVTGQALLVVMSWGYGAMAHAATGPFASLSGCPTVSDHVLDRMRGRYVSFGQVQYFGVQMQTVWTTASGSVMTSGVTLGFQFGHKGPRMGYTVATGISQGSQGHPQNKVDPSLKTSTLGTSQGVTQVIQLAADGNTATNNVVVNVTNTAQSGPVSTSDAPSTLEHNGIRITAGAADNGIGTDIVVPGQGEVRQQISGNALAAGVLQNIFLASGYNQVQNTLMLTLGVKPGTVASPGSGPAIGAALGTMMGIPRVGG